MRRREVGFLAFLLVVGFATVSAVLVVNGNINLAFDDADFTSNVVFTKAESADGRSILSTDKKEINFETKTLSMVNETAVLDYVVANKSRQYDANVTISCGLKNDFASFSEYLELTNDITSPFELLAGGSKEGRLTVKLKKAYTEEVALPELSCTVVASPISRESVAEYTYKDAILNGTDPVLAEGLVPLILDSDGTTTVADPQHDEWYDYQNKEWANAAILADNPSKTYHVGDIVDESDIESYFVWIPRFRYRMFCNGIYYATDGVKPGTSIAQEIDIIFEDKNTETSNGTKVGEWVTHPAFTNYNTNGIWVGKFETGYKGADSKVAAENDVTDETKVIVKPNVYSWRNLSVANMFKTALAYEENMNSHMMRNTEWGAVAYLSHSKFGISDEVRINNNSNYLTGYAANQKDGEASTTENQVYNTETGYLASTTGNITGVYDMSGGACEYVAGYVEEQPSSSGLTLEELQSDAYSKHLDVYPANRAVTYFKNRILGDATGEMGPFYVKSGVFINNWYDDYSAFVHSTYPWFMRGFAMDDGTLAGQFAFGVWIGDAGEGGGFRITLAI